MPNNISLIQGDVTNLRKEVKRKKYDIITALALLEHLPNPLQCLKQAKDILRPGGLFIATSPNPLWDHISSKLGFLKEDQHEVHLNKKAMISLIQESGLKLLEFNRFMWAPVAIFPYLKINVDPQLSLQIDFFVNKLFIFNWLFVNQIIIARA